MCIQCVGEGATYVAGAVGALHVMKVRAAHRLRPAPAGSDDATAGDHESATQAHEDSRSPW